MGKSIRHLRIRGRFEQRTGIVPKIIGSDYRASATELRSGEASSGRSDRGTKKGFVRNSGTETEERNRTCEFKDVVLE